MTGGEDALVEWLRTRFAYDASRVPVGIGDDAAVVRSNSSLIAITADMLLDGVHFDTGRHDLAAIGRKAIACSLSDCAAVGCAPRAATVSVALPRSMSLSQIKRLYEGMGRIADEFDCAIVGGDTTSWAGKLAIDVAMLAEPMAERGPVLRSGAQPGDSIYVSGPLGGSLAGKHLTFTPRLDLARQLVREPGLHAMMDISDGLALDLHRLCVASICDAELSAEQLEKVVSDDARRLSAEDGRSPLDHALGDGEDFELLVAGRDLDEGRLGLIRLGTITPRAGSAESRLTICHADGRRKPIAPVGYEHL